MKNLRKILPLLLAAFSLSCAGCGAGEREEPLPPVIGAETDAGTIATEEVDETVWDSALGESAFENVSVRITADGREERSFSLLSGDRSYSSEENAAGRAEYFFLPAEAGAFVCYYRFVVPGGAEGEWEASAGANNAAASRRALAALLSGLHFGDLSLEGGAYTAEGTVGEIPEPSLKFYGGKLLSFSYAAGEGRQEYLFYDYGTTEVAAPELPAALGRTEWERATSSEAFSDCTVEVRAPSPCFLAPLGGTATLELDGDRAALTHFSADGQVFSLGEGRAALYTERGGAWTAEESENYAEEGDPLFAAYSVYLLYRRALPAWLMGRFDDFAYDATYLYYRAEDLTFSFGNDSLTFDAMAYFKGGRLTSLRLIGEEGTVSVLFSAYGTTEVALPLSPAQ